MRLPLPSLISPHSTVSTNIWSDSNAGTNASSPRHLPEKVEDHLDSPKMGTRAYRERERREMELEAVMEEDRGRSAEEEGVVVRQVVERRESSAERGDRSSAEGY